MASAGFSDSRFRLDLNVWLITQEVANNRSLIGWSLVIVKTGSSTAYYLNADSSFTRNVDGETSGWNFGYDFRSSSSLTLASGEKWVTHNTDGTKAYTSSASVNGAGIIGSAAIGSFSTTLPTIPRASVPTIDGGNSFDAGSAITIQTNRASTSFTHTLEYTFGAASGTIGTNVGASKSWTPPLSLLQEIPNAASGTGTLTCKTYSGATLIGTKTLTFTVTAPASAVPTIGGLTLSEGNAAVASGVGAYVQGQSTLDWAITGVAGYQGSTIASYELQVGSQAFTGQSGETAAIADAGSVTVTAKVTDSRGRVGTSSQVVSVLAWSAPAITSTAIQRALSGGTPDPNGTYVRVDLAAAVSSLVNGTQKNALRYRTRHRVHGTTTWTDTSIITPGGLTISTGYVVAGPFSESLSYDVRVEVLDLFATSASQSLVPVATVTLDLGDGTAAVGAFHQGIATFETKDAYFDGDVEVIDDISHRGGLPVEPIGLGALWFTDTPPTGFLLLQGQAISRTTYSGLFALFGTTYGAGNGSTTFNLPDLRFRVPVGKSTADSEFAALGQTGGAKTHTHFEGTLRAAIGAVSNDAASIGYQAASPMPDGRGPYSTGAYSITGGVKGGNNSFNHYTPVYGTTSGGDSLQPYITVNYIVKAQ